MTRQIAALFGLLATAALIPFMIGSITDKLLYYPMRYPQGLWQLQGPSGAQERWFSAADGTKLNAWWYPASSHLATLFLHGNAGNVTHRVDHAKLVRQAGSAILILDYRGYGKSEGTPGEQGLYTDADAAFDELTRVGYTPERIVIHGESLGTAVATDLAARRPCAGLILESPFESLRRMAGKVVPFLGPMLAHGYDTYSKVQKVRVPVLVIHGDADEIVPFSQGEAVFAAANQPKQFWRIHGGTHNDLLYAAGPEYVSRLKSFYASLPR